MTRDRPGLAVGDLDRETSAVAVGLDVSPGLLEFAEELGARLVVTHHPLLMNPPERIDLSTPLGRLIESAIKSDIVLYSAHTNFDAIPEGSSQILAERLELTDTVPFGVPEIGYQVKLVTFVPESHLSALRAAMAAAGGGRIGEYGECAFQTPGTGTFRPLEGADPFTGTKGELSKEPEVRLEMIVLKERLSPVLSAMLEAHPYEEVAYDVYPLENRNVRYGFGRLGRWKARRLQDAADFVRERLNAAFVRTVGGLDATVETVAVCAGSGITLMAEAFSRGADVFVTGDVKYHSARDAEQMGKCLIDPGHHATESPVVDFLAEYISEQARVAKVEIEVQPFHEPDVFSVTC